MTTVLTKYRYKITRVAIPLLLVAVCACTPTSGTTVTNDQLKEFKVGSTTYAQVVDKLGKPNAITTSDDGGIVAAYTGGTLHVKPETYIPIAGAFVGGTESTAHTVILNFNKRNILTHIQQADSAIATHM
jgi:outer membrane protein assembly factor BamE (lipoprotein component of BamABCDE complex)